MKVTALIRDDGACGVYRVEQPLNALKAKTGTPVRFIRNGDSTESIAKGLEADVIVIPRPSEDILLDAMKKLQKEGKKLVVDHDDDIFHISPLSPHYEDFGTENIAVTLDDGTVLDVWEDGKNIDLERNKIKKDQTKRALRMADMVTVTTEILANVYREFNNNVVVLPNCINTDIWKPLPLQPTDEIRLFWAGGHSHYEDWCLLADVIPDIMAKYDKVRLVILGARFDGTLKKIPVDRIEYHSWVPTLAYPYKVAAMNPTIGVIPLLDNDFNRCKSAIKWLEMASLGVPCVTSHVSPYKEIATEDNGIFIERNSPRAWFEGISMLIESKLLRAKIGGTAQKYLYDNYDAKKRSGDWLKAYESMFEDKYNVINEAVI